jgi:hypothetical protein
LRLLDLSLLQQLLLARPSVPRFPFIQLLDGVDQARDCSQKNGWTLGQVAISFLPKMEVLPTSPRITSGMDDNQDIGESSGSSSTRER